MTALGLFAGSFERLAESPAIDRGILRREPEQEARRDPDHEDRVRHWIFFV